jgi:hypothetical protein
MVEIIRELEARNIDYIFLIFHPFKIRNDLLNEKATDWRSTFISNILDENNITYIWSKDIIFQNMKANNISLREFYMPDYHPSPLQRELIAERLKNIVLSSELSSNIE